ncbi:MAG TPA: DegT/DnrJ/EryC1/StrS family aminotransferase [Ktedonobacteraceae bacterium]
MISIAHPLLGSEEATAVMGVLASGQLAQGEQVAEFERRFAEMCGVSEAVAVSSGTAALYLALLAHNIGQGDEVITTAFSFVATANVILQVGATPVFVDIDPETYNIDPALVKAAITSRTRAIMPVHLYGNPCDMKQLEEIARIHNLVILEDACQAHAAKIDEQVVGSFGTGCFSFYPTKNMTTGEGGIVTTNQPAIAERIRLLRNHGQKIRYVHTSSGYNMRMTNLQAAIGLVQLEKLVRFNEQRIENAQFLTTHLKEVLQTPVSHPGYRHVYHQYTIRVPEHRDQWATLLHERGVGTGVHYPIPIYQQPYYQEIRSQFRVSSPEGNAETGLDAPCLPETELAAKQVLSLPVHPALSKDDLSTIVREVLTLCGN